MYLRINGQRIYRHGAPFDSAPLLAWLTVLSLRLAGKPTEN